MWSSGFVGLGSLRCRLTVDLTLLCSISEGGRGLIPWVFYGTKTGDAEGGHLISDVAYSVLFSLLTGFFLLQVAQQYFRLQFGDLSRSSNSTTRCQPPNMVRNRRHPGPGPFQFADGRSSPCGRSQTIANQLSYAAADRAIMGLGPDPTDPTDQRPSTYGQVSPTPAFVFPHFPSAPVCLFNSSNSRTKRGRDLRYAF